MRPNATPRASKRSRLRPSARTALLGLSALVLLASPALAAFDVPSGSRPAPSLHFGPETLAPPTSFTCTWTAGSQVQLDWTASSSSWYDATKVAEDASDDVHSITAGTSLKVLTGVADPVTTPRTWKARAAKNAWRSAFTSSLVSNAGCGNAITTIAKPVGTAKVQDPEGIAFDSSGNLYIADTGNHAIRKLDRNNTLTTVVNTAGTLGSTDNVAWASGKLNVPEAVAVASNGDLYIADTNNNRIRKAIAGGNITTIVGNGTAGTSVDGTAMGTALVDHPTGIAVASNGDIWYSDRGGAVLRQIPFSGGSAGTVQTRYSTLTSPQGLAFDSTESNVYVADQTSHKVVKVLTVSPWTATLVAGGNGAGATGDGAAATAAKLDAPDSVAVTSDSDVYIADVSNKKIRKVTVSTGFISSWAGTSTAGYSGAGYPRLTPGGTTTLSQLNLPHGVALDPVSGNVYISDTNNDLIRRVTAHTRPGGSVDYIFPAAGNNTGGFTDGNPAATMAISKPQGVAVDSSGNVFIADVTGNRIREWFYGSNDVATIVGTGAAGNTGDDSAAISAKLEGPEGIAVASDGTLYIADTVNNRIRKVDATTSEVITNYAGNSGGSACASGCDNANPVAAAARFKQPSDLVLDSSNNLFVADTATHSIRKVVASGGALSTHAGLILTSGTGTVPGAATGARFTSPDGIAIDASNNLLVADTGNNRIIKIDTAGTPQASHLAGTTAQNTSCAGTATTGITLSAPSDVVWVGSDFYIADSAHHRVCKVVVGTNTSTSYLGDGALGTAPEIGWYSGAELETPMGIAYSSTTGMIVSHTVASGRVRRVALVSGALP